MCFCLKCLVSSSWKKIRNYDPKVNLKRSAPNLRFQCFPNANIHTNKHCSCISKCWKCFNYIEIWNEVIADHYSINELNFNKWYVDSIKIQSNRSKLIWIYTLRYGCEYNTYDKLKEWKIIVWIRVQLCQWHIQITACGPADLLPFTKCSSAKLIKWNIYRPFWSIDALMKRRF